MEIFDFKCKYCGGEMSRAEGMRSVGKCKYCGSKQTLPKLYDEKRAIFFDRANHLRRNNEFDKAEGLYEQILNEDPTDPEAYWSLVLCRYGIEYVEEATSRERKPTVNRTQLTSIFADENYKSAIKYADNEQKKLYEREAKAINEIQKGILEISRKEEPFDVFICYKETDEKGKRSVDSVLAHELYRELTRDGYKVFFARETLHDKTGSAYEPYIFSALSSAKVMVVLGTKKEHFEAAWVRNEWSRFLGQIKKGEKKVLFPVYRDMDAYDLPVEFANLQALDMDRLGYLQELISGVENIVKIYKKPKDKKDSDKDEKQRSKKASVIISLSVVLVLIVLTVFIIRGMINAITGLAPDDTGETDSQDQEYTDNDIGQDDIPDVLLLRDNECGITVESKGSSFPQDASLEVVTLSTSGYYTDFSAIPENMMLFDLVYDISITENGQPYTHDGDMTVTLPIPYFSEGIEYALLYAPLYGVAVEVECTVRDGVLSFVTDRGGAYIIAEIYVDPSYDTEPPIYIPSEGDTSYDDVTDTPPEDETEAPPEDETETPPDYETETPPDYETETPPDYETETSPETSIEPGFRINGALKLSNTSGNLTSSYGNTLFRRGDGSVNVTGFYKDCLASVTFNPLEDLCIVSDEYPIVLVITRNYCACPSEFEECYCSEKLDLLVSSGEKNPDGSYFDPIIFKLVAASEISDKDRAGNMYLPFITDLSLSGLPENTFGISIESDVSGDPTPIISYDICEISFFSLEEDAILYYKQYIQSVYDYDPSLDTLTPIINDTNIPGENGSVGLYYTLINNETEYEVSDIGTCTDTEIVIPSTFVGKAVTSIGDSAFTDRSSLTSISIPESVTSIGVGAFYGCSSLTNINIPNSVTSIGSSAFAACSSLKSIYIPESVTSIQQGTVFAYCNNLENIIVAESNPVYHSEYYCLIETASNTLVAGCKNSKIPEDGSVTVIGEFAFYGCNDLTSIYIPDSVTVIENYAFSECKNLKSIVIPNSVTSIGPYAFKDCSSITNIKLPSSLTSISDYPFEGCSNLTSITFDGTVEQWNSLDNGTGWLSKVENITIYCLDGDIAK